MTAHEASTTEKNAASGAKWVQWGGLATMASGVTFAALSLLSLATTVQASLLDVGLVVANLLSLGAAVGLHTLQKDRYGYLGRGGFVIVVVGILTNTLGTAAHVLGVLTLEVPQPSEGTSQGE